jgi:PadR family transcriptional regulator PadR
VGLSSSRDSPALKPLQLDKNLLTAWLLLLLETEASYGYELHRRFAALSLNPHPSVLYRRLRELERNGWIASTWEPAIGGPRRRRYALTSQGQHELVQVTESINIARDRHDTFLRMQATASSAQTLARPPDS